MLINNSLCKNKGTLIRLKVMYISVARGSEKVTWQAFTVTNYSVILVTCRARKWHQCTLTKTSQLQDEFHLAHWNHVQCVSFKFSDWWQMVFFFLLYFKSLVHQFIMELFSKTIKRSAPPETNSSIVTENSLKIPWQLPSLTLLAQQSTNCQLIIFFLFFNLF